MKKLLLLFSFFVIAFNAQAQLDTVLIEDFQNVDIFTEWQLYPNGDDLVWTTFDYDGIDPNDGADEHRAWFSSNEFWPDTTGNFVAASYSWLAGSALGNRNYLTTPPIEVNSPNFTLHWKSASLQLPRYLDGYQVLVSTLSNGPDDFTDTLFTAASMESITGDGNIPTLDNYSFTPGYIHANDLTDTLYWDYFSDSTLLHGILEPHSVSLAAYNGKKIYITWLHDSDDDYFLSVDDILVTDGQVVAAPDLFEENLRFVTYPNPVVNQLNVLFRLDKTAHVQIEIIDALGKRVGFQEKTQQSAGDFVIPINTTSLEKGTYFVVLRVDDRLVSRKFIK